jgi:hypothetical protein
VRHTRTRAAQHSHGRAARTDGLVVEQRRHVLGVVLVLKLHPALGELGLLVAARLEAALVRRGVCALGGFFGVRQLP